jgi:5-methylthioadenosine/S-adenosylhomocysteine deaminase
MGQKKRPPTGPTTQGSKTHAPDTDGGLSRRDFLKSTTAGLVAGAVASADVAGTALAGDGDAPGQGKGAPPGRLILLKGGIVLTMDPAIGDFEKADVLIEGSKIKAVAPNISAEAQVIDVTGMIVMPGFIDTHHHQYETIQRSIIPDGILGNFAGVNWPQENYVSVVQNIWTTGRIPRPTPADPPIWDLGRSPYDPEDCYISELVASLTQIDQGITTGVDTSQSSHTPEHTDAMIQGLIDSGRRSLYVYTGGRADDNRGGYEYPGTIGNTTTGLGRLRTQWFNTEDQLVTLGFSRVAGLFGLARSFGAVIVNHNVGDPAFVTGNVNAVDALGQPILGPDLELIHCVRWTEEAWQIAADMGIHVSIAVLIEMQMQHGMPPLQLALDHGILPSLSSDVDTNMTADMFSQMRAAFCLQRALLNERYLAMEPNLPPLLTCHQVLEMATIAGAAAARLDHKVGTLTPGKEADIIVLDARALSCVPMNNAPGTVVTRMDTSNVKHVFIAGQLRKRDGKLVGVDVDKLRHQIEASRDAALARIQAVPIPIDGLRSAPGYTPSFLGSCCIAEEYGARP